MYVGLASLLLIGLVVIAATSLLVPADVIASSTARTPAGRALVERFVGRSRRFRTIGGLVGIAVSLMVTSSQTEGSDITIGFLPALAGAVIGSIIAESFRIRRSRGPRSATLEVRSETDYTDEAADGREYVVGFVTVLLTAVGIAQADPVVIGLAVLVAGIAVVRRWAQRQVVLRGRPVLDTDLGEADDEVRRMAVRHGIARPTVTLMALLVAGQAAALPQYYGEVSAMRNVLGVTSMALTITALVWWWTNRNFGFSSANPRRSAAAAISVVAVIGALFAFMLVARVGG